MHIKNVKRNLLRRHTIKSIVLTNAAELLLIDASWKNIMKRKQSRMVLSEDARNVEPDLADTIKQFFVLFAKRIVILKTRISF